MEPLATGPACITQSHSTVFTRGNLQVVVLQGHDLVHYWHDSSEATTAWHRSEVIMHTASGPGCLVESDFTTNGHRNLEVVVPEADHLVHYWQPSSPAMVEIRTVIPTRRSC